MGDNPLAVPAIIFIGLMAFFFIVDQSCGITKQVTASEHCRTLGHSEGKFDDTAKRIRCFDVTRTEVEAK